MTAHIDMKSIVVKWTIMDSFDVRAILTTEGFTQEEVRKIFSDYVFEHGKVDVQAFQKHMTSNYCLSLGKQCYVTFI